MTKNLLNLLAKNRTVSRTVVILLGLLFVAIGAHSAYRTYEQVVIQTSWTPVQGEVLNTFPRGRRSSSRYYSVRYRYTIDGKTYVDASDADDAPGRVVNVQVNPADHSDSAIERSYLFWIVWVLLFIPIGILFIVRGELASEDA